MKRVPLVIVAFLLAVGALRLLPGDEAAWQQGRRTRTSAGALAGSFFGIDEPRRSPRELERIRRTLRERATGTYIDEMLAERDSSLARWPDRRRDPIRVWIAGSSDVRDWSPSYVDAVRNAFLSWDDLGLPARFAFVSDSAAAEVTVVWTDRFSQPISGRTRWARDEHWWITDASITLAVHHHQGETLADDAMHAMALHEIGHLLGLDHTGDVGAVMAPRVRVRELSDADRATARLLYSLPPGAVR
ncbi:MAG TPA: matrixin family metalloprotease [Gemmatimonadaceae bacterium]|nr:matrixin family metalloprotease [Gemmatimonadaceae bacterium]